METAARERGLKTVWEVALRSQLPSLVMMYVFVKS